MRLPTPTVPIPEPMQGEWSIFDHRTATGLFAYRQCQAKNLLDLPDVGGGDLDAKGRREALRGAVTLHKPLSALSLFLGMVSFEDFVRDLGSRLADAKPLRPHFPALKELRAQPKQRASDQLFRRLDTDPFPGLDPEDINQCFAKAMGITPVPVCEYWHLRDLALLRHTVAHHAAVVRAADVPRFAHFVVRAGMVINPPPDFVRNELDYIYRLGRMFEIAVRDAAFAKVIRAAGAGWSQGVPSPDVIELIELFAFFGYLETTTVAVGFAEPGTTLWNQQQAEAKRIRALLLQRCIDDLIAQHGA